MSGINKCDQVLVKIGEKIWDVDFMVDYVMETGSTFETGEDYEVWSEAIFENVQLLKKSIAELKGALCDLPEGVPQRIGDGYQKAEAKSKALGRAWSEEREEQLRQLRLAGDDTPEAEVPFGPLNSEGGAA